VATLLDTTIFVRLERELKGVRPDLAISEVARRLDRDLGPDEEVGIAAITASELLHGVHRATEVHRMGRAGFVEVVLEAFPLIRFDLLCARVHALLWANQMAAGADMGAHDRLIAATAIAGGWRVATSDARHFSHVAHLVQIIDPRLTA
jgi:tRNA(fMet)-specific endonuclease VapC